MSQEYTVKYFKVGDYIDDNGNTWCNVLFEEHSGEPVRWVVKDPSTVQKGQKVYGRIEEKTSKAGKQYNRFYREPRPDPSKGGSTWQPRDDAAIKAQFAIKTAVQLLHGTKDTSERTIEDWAKKFFAMVDRVKGSEAAPKPAVGSADPADQIDEDFMSLIERGLNAQDEEAA